jgi:hypothetical protein
MLEYPEATMRMALFLVTAAILAVGPADARQSMKERGEADLAKELKGYVPGKQVRCISLSDISGQHVIDGTAIVYRGFGGRIYVNRPRGAEFLREDNILISRPTGSEICRLDLIRQRDRFTHMQGAAVGLNDFTVYTKVR